MHMNLLQVQIKSLSAKPSLVHLGIVYSSQSPTGAELPSLLMSVETPHVKEIKQSPCFSVLEMRRTRTLRQQMLYCVNKMPGNEGLDKPAPAMYPMKVLPL